MIYFRTCAYNAEKTIRRTIESVMNQTVVDWKYYILENGSNDSTREIIEEYASKDSRIVPFYNEVNRRYEENPDFWNISHNINDDDYFVILDADDFYANTFLEDILEFMKENNLDVAACGSTFIDEDGNEIGTMIQKQDFLLRTPEEYNENFSYAHWNMRQVWGKVYAGYVAKNRFELECPDWWPHAYGGDTINVMHCLKQSRGFGILAKGLHYYQVSNKSVSYKWVEGREDSDIILDSFAKEFLIEKVGRISDYNRRFLSVVYINALKDTIKVLLSAELLKETVVEIISTIFNNNATKEIFEYDYGTGYGATAKNELAICRKILLDWTISNYKHFDEDGKKNSYLFIKSYGEVVGEIIPEIMMDKLLVEKPEIITSLLNGQIGSLVKLLQEFVDAQKFNETFEINEIILCQNLAAFLGLEELYVLYSKYYIEELIRLNDINGAKSELEEWMQVLPDDKELQVMYENLE